MCIGRGGGALVAKWTACGLWVCALLACAGLPLRAFSIPLEHERSEAEVQEAEQLVETLEGSAFSDEVLADCKSASLLTWLAARHADGRVVAASLWGMAACAEDLHPPDALAVASARLRSEDRGVQGGAMAVAQELMPHLPPDSDVIARVALLASEDGDGAVRIEALEALDRRPWSTEPTVVDAFFAALHAENAPTVVATALDRIQQRAAGFTADDRLRLRLVCQLLTQDRDPAIRGISAQALAQLDPSAPAVLQRLMELLEDRHGYTRAIAADALAALGHEPAIPILVAGVPDEAACSWKMLPWTRLNGTDDRLTFVASPFDRVDHSWLMALEALTAGSDSPFVLRDINQQYLGLDLIAAGRDAARWLEAHPRLGQGGDPPSGDAP